MNKPGRNDPCPCGSGKKYKQCCGRLATPAPAAPPAIDPEVLAQGLALCKQGRFKEAYVALYFVWDRLPSTPLWLDLRGHMAMAQDLIEEAARCWEGLARAEPANASAWFNLAQAQRRLGQSQEAVQSFRQSLDLLPRRAQTHKSLGDTLVVLGQLDAALACYQTAHECEPTWLHPINEMATVHTLRGELGAAIEDYRRLLTLQPDEQFANSNLFFAMALDPGQRLEDFWREHARYSARLEGPLGYPARPPRRWRPGSGPIRVGYVSPDFRVHAIANFIEPILRHSDTEGFEVYAYYNGEIHDAVTQRFRQCVPQWRNCYAWTDDQLAEVIRMDGIDILVDLAGHTANNRLQTFARRPAHLQITYLGYPGSSWLKAMDWRLTDARSDPDGAEAFYCEPLARLPDSLFCYQPMDDVPEVQDAPCLRNGYVTFGSFASYSKITDDCLQLWARILVAVPGAQLLMITVPEGQAQQRLRQRMQALGVDPARVQLYPRQTRPDYLAMMHRADIALDPIAINSPTTLCETVWMGLPVVSRYGQRCATRAGLSVLHAAGLADLAVPDDDTYVQRAVALASNPQALVQARRGCRERLRQSPLMDGPRFVRHLEQIYRRLLGAD